MTQKIERVTFCYLQVHGRSPTKLFLDQGVVRVPTAHTLWPRNVMDRELLVIEAKDYLRHLIHAHHLVTPDIHGLTKVGFGQSADVTKD